MNVDNIPLIHDFFPNFPTPSLLTGSRHSSKAPNSTPNHIQVIVSKICLSFSHLGTYFEENEIQHSLCFNYSSRLLN